MSNQDKARVSLLHMLSRIASMITLRTEEGRTTIRLIKQLRDEMEKAADKGDLNACMVILNKARLMWTICPPEALRIAA